MNQHINDVSLQTLIKLNNKIRNSDNTDLATDMKIIHQMRLELGKMIFKLHNLHLKVNDTLDQIGLDQMIRPKMNLIPHH